MQAKTETERQVLELITPVCEEMGLTPVRVRLMGRDERRILQIMAERDSDQMLGIDECTRLSRAISQLIDVADPIPGQYDLEVSSPGIDRPLTLLRHFESWDGFEAKIELDRLVEGRRRFKGVLAGVDDGHVGLDIEGEDETAMIPFDWIADARLVMNDELMEASGARAAAASEETEQGDNP